MSNLYTSSSLTFHSDKIVSKMEEYGNEEVIIMMDWEHPVMSASAAYVTQGGGDILEIGFGMGIASNYIQSHSISSHTIVENHPQIIEKLETWASGKSNINIISQSWADVTGSLGRYDGIFYDTEMDERYHLFSSSLSTLTKSGTKLSFWNSNVNESNMFNINLNYKQINVIPEVSSSQYFPSGSTTYYMPMKEF
tara:strand:- start:17 stop:601 length:585 start_codon:yes stop_codon:yes gene_type:complete